MGENRELGQKLEDQQTHMNHVLQTSKSILAHQVQAKYVGDRQWTQQHPRGRTEELHKVTSEDTESLAVII